MEQTLRDVHPVIQKLTNSFTTVKPRVLVVDDEADIRSALVRLLELEGYRAEEASSGYEALDLLERRTYDLMILDMRMPGLNGLSVMEQVRQLDASLMVIVLTGHATLDSAIAAAKSDDVVNYLVKPVKNDELVRAVAEAWQKRVNRLSQRQMIDAAAQMLDALHQQRVATPSDQLASPDFGSDRFLHTPPITLDLQKKTVVRQDDPARSSSLTEGELNVLTTLMANPNQVLSCRELVRAGWDYNVDESEAESIIRPYIFRLRRKIETNPKKPRLIRTVRKRGYLFAPASKSN
jgi:DNA-binding response OmpR family regulator